MTPLAKKLIAAAAIAVAGTGGYFSFVYDPAPLANPDQAEMDDTAPAEILVLSNDTDRAKDVVRVVGVGDPEHGNAVVAPGGSHVVYAPDPGFGGEDRFAYEVADKAGQRTEGQVVVEVTFTAPEFHKRNTAASLQEMLSEPATSIYGSTIDVFVFRDSENAVREITIAGHADSITCSVASGAFASALIESGLHNGNFLLAGAGRLSIPMLSDEDRARLLADPDVNEYGTLKSELDTMRFLVSSGVLLEENVSAIYGWTLSEGQARLETLETHVAVRDYLLSAVAAESAEAFLDQARELQETSGLLRLHELRFDAVGAVLDRLMEAARVGKPSVMTFADLVSGEEAVVYAPMLMVGSGKPVTLEIPVGNFSPEGFRAAAKEHRSALEKAVENSAQRRLDHATRILEEERQTKLQCEAASALEREEAISTEFCDQDECGVGGGPLQLPFGLGGNQMTFGEYCDVNNPKNLSDFARWQEDAREILDRMKRLRDEQDSLSVDALTHAALIDSMLRDWALPMPDAQAAFDHWRTVGRTEAWRALTAAMAEQGIARAAISGESVVFDVSLDGDTLMIRPMLAIDLAQSRVVVDPELGALAAVTPWELREISELAAVEPESGDIVSLLLTDRDAYMAALHSDPAGTMGVFLDELFALLPEQVTDKGKRHEFAKLNQIHQLEQELRPLLREERAKSGGSQEDALASLQIISFAARAIRDHAGFRPDFVSETIHANGRALMRLLEESDAAAWRFAQALVLEPGVASQVSGDKLMAALMSAGAGTAQLNRDLIRRLETALYGSSLQEVVDGAISQLNETDRKIVVEAFAQPFASNADLPDLPELPPVTIIDQLTSDVEVARTALMQRRAIDKAFAAFDETGRVSVEAVREAIETAPTGTDPRSYFSWSKLLLDLRFMHLNSNEDTLNPIDGNALAGDLGDRAKMLDTLLTNLKPRLVALRYGRDQDAIAARLLFDEGAYLQALDRLVAKQTPLSLYAPNLAWEVLTPDLKAIPDDLSLKVEGDAVVAEAKIGGNGVQVLRFTGLDRLSREALISANPEPLLPWNDGDPLWEQILLAVVPAQPESQKISAILAEDGLRLATLKAMVYACAVPGNHLLDPGGRCAQANGSTALHDRVRSGAVSFALPDSDRLEAAALERFTFAGAWRLREASD